MSILLEYRWYFPADFSSPFLTGRRESFTTLYATAFYTHILGGPLTILLGTFMLATGGMAAIRSWHRWAGRGQIFLILFALVPSSLIMAPQAFAGPIAAVGFTALALATAWCAAMTVYCASTRQFVLHERWARRLFVLLISPLLLRLASGGLIVMHWESEMAYILNAWFSWLVPLAIYETWWRSSAIGKLTALPHEQPGLTREALP
ncbi:MAG: DUF2306 domain-containing protein [Planctomycetaceae bacterium]|nr:DUF2306 domain-containing protein [Planctomycetaceae bacterium]